MSRAREDRLLADKLRRIKTEEQREKNERLLTNIANLHFPEENYPGSAASISEDEKRDFLGRLRASTELFWPQLWDADPDQEPPEQTMRVMRDYLRRFWREPDERTRDWYIHRAREYHQRRLVLAATRVFRKNARNATTAEQVRLLWEETYWQTERTLDEPPPRTPFEDALFELQLRAGKPSLAPRYCPNPLCDGPGPYFLSSKKGQRFCSVECAGSSSRASKRKYWGANKPKLRRSK